MTAYADFIAHKHPAPTFAGPDVTPSDVHETLHDWQAEIVCWAIKIGRAAIWADTGLGKTFMQIEWARLVAPDAISLVVAPLAVCHQTTREAAKLGLEMSYVRSGVGLGPGMYVTNYEMIEHFDAAEIAAVVLDEASILKQSDGKTRTRLIDQFAEVPFRLSCTATPAPNDPEELTNQAEFLGHSTRVNMLAAYFIHDEDGWRLKGHARNPMIRWMATWAVAIRKPSDLGYDDIGYDLPGLNVVSHLLPVEIDADGQLFPTDLGGVGGRAAVRKETLRLRCERAAELINSEPDEPWLIWCGLNAEAEMLAALTGATNVHGGLTPEQKAEYLLAFADGDIARLVTKPSLAAFGLNWQHCARMVFVGLSDSYEAYYQAIRRCYRYGQPRIVDAHVVLSELEGQIATNIARKERESSTTTAALVNEMRRTREGVTA
jgi:hypothetical protein